MNSELANFIKALSEISLPEDEYMLEGMLYDISAPLEGIENIDEAIPHIFRFFEVHPNGEHGSPGALVHLLETYPGRYEGALKDSVSRVPTYHTIWMVNRILNSQLDQSEREDWISLLKSAIANQAASDAAVSQAEHFLEFQDRD